jgi:hypothetical protein
MSDELLAKQLTFASLSLSLARARSQNEVGRVAAAVVNRHERGKGRRILVLILVSILALVCIMCGLYGTNDRLLRVATQYFTAVLLARVDTSLIEVCMHAGAVGVRARRSRCGCSCVSVWCVDGLGAGLVGALGCLALTLTSLAQPKSS